jgi:hypothetical protein
LEFCRSIEYDFLKRLGPVGSAQTLYRHLGACFFDFFFDSIYNSSMTKILVAGDCYSEGFGLKLLTHDPDLWINKLCSQVFNTPQIDNISSTGANANTVFLNTASAILQKNYDVVIVGWGSTPRFNFNVGLELYHTRTMFADAGINLNSGVTIPGSYLKDIGDKLKGLYNPHWLNLELIKYVNILYDMQVTHRNRKLFFVNHSLVHCNNFFQRTSFNIPSELDPYVQGLLEVSARCDREVYDLYSMIYDQYQLHGGIREDNWLNLYKSLADLQVDKVSATDNHAGYQSQLAYVEYLAPLLQKKLNENSHNNNS